MADEIILVHLNNTFSAGYIQPIPIWAWEIDLSESWLKGICSHAPDEDYIGCNLSLCICIYIHVYISVYIYGIFSGFFISVFWKEI